MEFVLVVSAGLERVQATGNQKNKLYLDTITNAARRILMTGDTKPSNLII